MNHDKIIEGTHELERRLHARRASDRHRDGDGLARKWNLLQAAATIASGSHPYGKEGVIAEAHAYVQAAEALLDVVEVRVRERQQAGHEAWLERSELKGENHE